MINDGLTVREYPDPNEPHGVGFRRARHSMGLVDPEWVTGEDADLVTEFLNGAERIPWNSREDRDNALRYLPTACWIAPDIREKLVEYVRRTPWFECEDGEDEGPSWFEYEEPGGTETTPRIVHVFCAGHGCDLFYLPDSNAKSGRISLPGRYSSGWWDEVPGGLLDEMRKGAGVVPWVSAAHRQNMLDKLRNGSSQFERHGPEVVAQLIRHVEKSPYWLEADDDYVKTLTGFLAPGGE